MAENKPAANANIWTFVSDREVRVERVYDAPRDLVFRAYTDPNRIGKWWGPRYLTTAVEEMDVRPGGRWRYVQRDPNGTEYGFHGEYLVVEPPARLVSTFEFEGAPGSIIVDSAAFEELGDRTKLTITSTTDNPEALKGMMAEGMQEGANETYDRLGEVLDELVRTRA